MVVKRIAGSDDLALYGARPAFSEVLHVGRPNLGDRDAFLRLVGEILDRRWLTNNGPVVQEFERRVAEYLGVRHCVAVCNGTVALEIAIKALGLTGEVIVPSWTFIATAHALRWQGIKPVFADIDPQTHNLDPAAVARKITARTTGIIGVHLWGRPARVDLLESIADAHGLKLMFDAAHAVGCSWHGRKIGNFGCAEVLSFHATKFFNSCEGGAVVTNDDALAESLRLMRNFGFVEHDHVVCVGTNGKMSELSAAMGLVNLECVPRVIASNRRHYLQYRSALDSIPGVRVLSYEEVEEPNYQYVVVELDESFPVDRDLVVSALQAENILARRYFWPGCHAMQPYCDDDPNAAATLPFTTSVAGRVVVLPTGTSLPDDAVAVTAAVFRVLAKESRKAPRPGLQASR